MLLIFILLSPVRAACTLFSKFLISLERFAPVLKISSPFRAVCALLSNSLVLCKRFASCSHSLVSFTRSISVVSFEWFALFLKLSSLFRAVFFCSQFSKSLSSGLLPVLKFSSFFRVVCSVFSNSLVSFAWFALCSRNLLVLFKRFAPCSQDPLVVFERLAPCSEIL